MSTLESNYQFDRRLTHFVSRKVCPEVHSPSVDSIGVQLPILSRLVFYSHPVSEAAQSPRLLIVRPQSSLSSTDSKLVSRDPLREKCDGPRSPTAVARRGWLERDSADRTDKHWSPTTSSAILSQSTGPVRRHWSPTASSVAISHASVS